MQGLPWFEQEPNDSDLGKGHCRVYNTATLRRNTDAKGSVIAVFRGYRVKPPSDGQIEKGRTSEGLCAFMTLGEP